MDIAALLFACACCTLCGFALAALYYRRAHKAQEQRISILTHDIEEALLGRSRLVRRRNEGELSKLQDEIDKTINALVQAERRATKTKEGFAENLSNIAHQLKTPIAALSLSLQQLSSDDPRTSQLITSMEEQIARLTRLQEGLLLMARLDAGVLSLSIETCDVFTILSMTAESLNELARAADVTLEITSEAPVNIDVDAHWTSEAIANIMRNCIEHAPCGSTITVNYAPRSLYTEITIADEGSGFSAQERLHAFERFYQGEKTNASSTGLGLSFAHDIIELQKGSIRIDDNPDGGALFVIRFYR